MDDLVAILTNDPIRTPEEVLRRSQAAEALSAKGPAARAAVPALVRALEAEISVDCALALHVAIAEALWKVGGRHDLALPFLAWALKDEYWGQSRKAAQVLAEMGPEAHATVPDLTRLADRRSKHGRFHFEEFEQTTREALESPSVLAVVAIALGRCGRGIAHWKQAHDTLKRLADSPEDDVRAAALQALDEIGTLDRLT